LRTIVKRAALVVPMLLLALHSATATAEVNDYSTGKKKADLKATGEAEAKKVPWRNSTITYENVVSALSFNEGAEMTYDPYYAQSFSFRPRYYLRDDLSLRARLDLEIELTTSDDTDHAREWILSDLSLDGVYTPAWMKIPVLGINVSPGLRMAFPTSIVSRGRSMMLSLSPSVAFRRSFELLKGRFLKNIGLTYAFRATKYFHEYTTAQLNTSGICSLTNPDNPACLHSGYRNVSWSLGNTFEVRLQVMEKLSLTMDLMLMNSLLYPLDSETYAGPNVPEVALGESEINHRAAVWGIIDVSYDLFDWLWLSLGISTYNPQLTPDSKVRAPFVNRYTAFYLDVTLPVDAFVNQVRTWVKR
jgi:hypothetical protein